MTQLKNKLILLAISLALLTSCADTQPQIKKYVNGHEYGFWGGLWHGVISPISFFGKLMDEEIDIYAINNNGNWYALGFVLGAGIILRSTTNKD